MTSPATTLAAIDAASTSDAAPAGASSACAADPLPALYAEAARLTRPLCLAGEGCGPLSGREFHCCEQRYCDQAAEFAAREYGITLPAAGEVPGIPFMSRASGCTVPPHLRPVCTLHVCSVTWAGTATLPGGAGALAGFLALRRRILALEIIAGRRIF